MSYGEPNIATKYLLFRLCRGRCYKPGCTKPVVKLVNGQAQTAAKIAHIYGRRVGAARYDARIPESHLKSFAKCDPAVCRAPRRCRRTGNPARVPGGITKAVEA